ncbi:MAG: tail fiber domain-containing protein [Chloroflexota bacterium]
MHRASLDHVARLLGDSTSRRAGLRAGLIAALGIGATDALAGDRAGTRRTGGERRDSGRGRGRRTEAGPGPAGPSDAARPGQQGPCGDGSRTDNTCSADGDCCTNYCVGKRCRCKARSMPCASRKECCRGLVCTRGACTEPASGSAGPTGPAGPNSVPTGPTGAILYNQGGLFGATSALAYDYANTGFVGIGVGAAGPTGALHVANHGASNPALVVQAASGQTGPVSLWLDDTGAEMFRLTGDTLGNVIFGKEAGTSLTTGDNNVGIGKSALKSDQDGYENVAIGGFTLENNTGGASNVAIGYYALDTLTDGDKNVAIGKEALYGATTGASNVGIGSQAGYALTTGLNNVFLGEGAGIANEDGEANTYIGYYAGENDSYGSFNTYIGSSAGSNTTDGDYNIAIGAKAYVADDTGSNQLSIGNLIYSTGLDGTETTISTGNIGIGVKAPTEKLEVDGNVKATNVTVPSDARLKQDIAPVSGALGTVAALRPATYGWKDATRFGTKREYGLIAQEVAPVVPSVVHGSEEDEFALDYAKLVPVLIGAIQELQARIDGLEARR